MDKRKQLIKQINIVINKLREAPFNGGILQLLHKRYKDALEILDCDKDIKNVHISGGVRAYLDSYSDYQNPLLEEMNKAENLLREYSKGV